MCCFLAFSHVGGPGHDIWRWWSYQSNTEYGSWSHSPGLRPRSHSNFSGRAASQGTLVSDLLKNIYETKTQVKAYFISCLDKCGDYIMFLPYILLLHSQLTAWPFVAVFSLWSLFLKTYRRCDIVLQFFLYFSLLAWARSNTACQDTPLSFTIQSNPFLLLNLKLFSPHAKLVGPVCHLSE